MRTCRDCFYNSAGKSRSTTAAFDSAAVARFTVRMKTVLMKDVGIITQSIKWKSIE
ncbi:hypothetical protein COMA2_210015 [Candidatus Nitrospira nitrificans]|uniref:Uncharacterized protein n=1 Tax=Candidatus Nitrospira nitrificans TaxID=1742973 RepID=A0A0S4LJV6_9BACT|nr:hypothetical protein COMA2_210015 [Candidatus Nitrospira nitrificans]